MVSETIYTSKFFEILSNESNEDLLSRYISFLSETQVEKSENTESHHIFPTSIFGDNDITVNIRMRDHFTAHVILHEMFKGKNEAFAKKMGNAVHKMVQGRVGFTPEEYEIARLALVYARKGTTTAYDKQTGKYIKILKGEIDNVNTFGVFCRILSDGKRTWISKEDPAYATSSPAETVQKYIDSETGEYIKLSPSIAKQNPERYRHCKEGIDPKISIRGTQNYYDPVTKLLIKTTQDAANKNGYMSCANYRDNEQNKIVFIPPSLAAEQPDRYVNANKGRYDVYIRSTATKDSKLIKIYAEEFDERIHMKRSEFNKIFRD